MENSNAPTRAELTDVANAIFDGTDAIMLSGETAKGKYPVEAITVMNNVALAVEKSSLFSTHIRQKFYRNTNKHWRFCKRNLCVCCTGGGR